MVHCMDEQVQKEMGIIIEALLFVSNEPVAFNKIHAILSKELALKKEETLRIIQSLKESYKDRAFELVEVAFGYQLKTKSKFYPQIKHLSKKRSQERLTLSAQEVLAIVAFKPSITRAEIDAIRGVDSSNIVQNLLEKELIQSVGVKEIPGKPHLYAPAEKFFLHFGIKSLEEIKSYR